MEENTVRQENAMVYLVKSVLLVILREKTTNNKEGINNENIRNW